MCGIAGFTGPENPDILARMEVALAHRGPDGRGDSHCGRDHVTLIHRRLAILDLTGGDQPMRNEDGEVSIVFNGEIYNHAELRRELVAAGHVFRSDHSDTEVLIHGYEEWGADMLERLNGMFAFCVHDRARHRLFFARDRFGKKPLYYAATPNGIAFASELRSILAHPGVDDTIDTTAVKKYFAYGFIPAPLSLYRSVRKLPGGCHMTFDIETRRLDVRTYYRFTAAPDDSLLRVPEGELAEELLTHLTAATGRRLVADRPVGIFLSGGLDSSAVLACAARLKPAGDINTFSLGFNEASYDESAAARSVAEHFGTRHFSEVLDLAKAERLIDDIVAKLDEPMGDSSLLPTYFLSEFARRHVVVALGGDGGDELLAGYAPFRALRPAALYSSWVPGPLHRVVRAAVEALPVGERYMSLDFKVKRALRGLSHPRSAWNPAWLGPLEPAEIGEILNDPTDRATVYDDAMTAWEESDAPDLEGKTTEFYVRFYMQDDILTKVDRASMSVGLEVRAPFLDNEVVAFARRLPTALKCQHGRGKHLLRRALAGKVPEGILGLPKKGLGIPLTAWLKAWPQPEASPLLPHDAARVRAFHQAHLSGKRDERLFLWCWLVLQHHLRDRVGRKAG